MALRSSRSCDNIFSLTLKSFFGWVKWRVFVEPQPYFFFESSIKKQHIFYSTVSGGNFPRTTQSHWCVENCRKLFSKKKNAVFWCWNIFLFFSQFFFFWHFLLFLYVCSICWLVSTLFLNYFSMRKVGENKKKMF